MTMPITGKLKDISDKKSTKKFTLADLEFTEKEIAENEHSLLPSEVIGDHSVHVIKSVKKGKNGKVKKSKKIWIDTNDYLIHKAEFYTKSGRLYRSVECTDVQTIEGISFPLKIFVKDLKSKSEIFVQLDKIEINPQFEAGLFIPKDQ
jgi:outer membrane lipoprotein-sorting protein